MSLATQHVKVCNGPPMDPPPFLGMHYVDTSSNQHYVSIGTTFVSHWILTAGGESIAQVNAPASSTTTVFTIPLANFCAVKYHICISNVAQDVQKTMILHAAKKSSGDVSHGILSILGDSIAAIPNFLVSGTDALLEVVNGEAFDLTVRFRTETI